MQTKEEILINIKSIVEKDTFNKCVISTPIKKGENYYKKIDIKRIKEKEKEYFHISFYIENKVVHKNIQTEEELFKNIIEYMELNFKQCDICSSSDFTILMNKKRQFKITGIRKGIKREIETHDRAKNYILKEGEYVEFLYRLKVMNKNGSVFSHMQKKFRQINKFLEILKSVEDSLEDNATIIDMGCGKSYLSFAMYHYFNNIKKKNINIDGYDLKKDVVKNCNSLSDELGFSKLKFFNDDIKNIEDSKKINMIVSLHACNTATDYAIYFGVKHNCDIILSVPCCQNEIFTQIKNDELSSMLDYGIIKERFSALLTDALRADSLKLCGYKTNIIEFIEMEHTPKNIMIKAIKNDKYKKSIKKYEEYKRIIEKFNLEPTIYTLLKKYMG